MGQSDGKEKKKSSKKEKKASKKEKHSKSDGKKTSSKYSLHVAEKLKSRHSKPVENVPSKSVPSQGVPHLEPQSQASVLVIGTEEQMFRILLKFGPTDLTERRHVQQLLAIPCQLCDPNELLPATIGALDNGLQGLAMRLRPDIGMSVRSLYLKKAVQQLGVEFRSLSDFYCLASVTLPYGLQEISASGTQAAKRWKRDVCNQIDLQVTAFALCRSGEASPAETGWRALKQTCGVSVAPELWEEQFQLRLRKELGSEFPIKCAVGSDSWMIALLLPTDATIEMRDGHLCFGPPSANPPMVLDATGGLQVLVQGRPYLPTGWSYVQCLQSGRAYFLNNMTQQSDWNPPQHELPEGWCRSVDAQTGQLYFFHRACNISTVEPPL